MIDPTKKALDRALALFCGYEPDAQLFDLGMDGMDHYSNVLAAKKKAEADVTSRGLEITRLRDELAEAEKSANYWYSVALGQKAPRAIEVEKAEADLADCNQRLTDARGIIKKLTPVDKEYLKQGQRTEAERDQYQSDWLSASATVVDYELEIDKLLELVEELQATAIVLRVECDEYIAYIGVLEQFISQYKPGPMLMDGRPECLADVLPPPTGSGEW